MRGVVKNVFPFPGFTDQEYIVGEKFRGEFPSQAGIRSTAKVRTEEYSVEPLEKFICSKRYRNGPFSYFFTYKHTTLSSLLVFLFYELQVQFCK